MKRLMLLVMAIVVAVIAAPSQAPAPAPSRNHPAIAYSSTDLNDPVTNLTRKIDSGEVRLAYDRESGYLRSILAALNVPIESQLAVFSKTSFQTEVITPQTPRTIFFNDSVAVARPRDGFIEIASTDPQQGVIFYTFGQRGRFGFTRDKECLTCHVSPATLGVPGLAIGSVYPKADGTPIVDAPSFITDHRSPLDERWGGWYVTGRTGTMKHLGNRVVANLNNPDSLRVAPTPAFESLEGRIDLTRYLSSYSDVVALMIFEHQAHMTNLITRLGWESRIRTHDGTKTSNADLVRKFVDYLLFVDEAPLPTKIEGTSGFAEKFQKLGPDDSKGRSLRQLDLERRLMRYPCSYMIYSPAFDAMPVDAKSAVYSRMWQILSGKDNSPKYNRLSPADRKAVIEILRETRTGLPTYFGQSAQ
jgi:hypothetical protein